MHRLINLLAPFLIGIFNLSSASGQGMAINASGAPADASAMLDVSSTTKGLLMPRMTTTQRTAIVSPAPGLMVYDSSLNSFYYNSGTSGAPVWTVLASGYLPTGTDGQILQLVGSVPTWVGTTLNIGDFYQGGIIAYLLQSGDDGYPPFVQHGLISDTINLSSGIQWYNGSSVVTNGVGQAIGTGKSNSDLIVSNQGSGSYAASLCVNYTGGGFTDWYLPSKGELQQLFIHRAAIGGFVSGFYWSSSEYSSSQAFIQVFPGGSQVVNPKSSTYKVRAVRKF